MLAFTETCENKIVSWNFLVLCLTQRKLAISELLLETGRQSVWLSVRTLAFHWLPTIILAIARRVYV